MGKFLQTHTNRLSSGSSSTSRGREADLPVDPPSDDVGGGNGNRLENASIPHVSRAGNVQFGLRSRDTSPIGNTNRVEHHDDSNEESTQGSMSSKIAPNKERTPPKQPQREKIILRVPRPGHKDMDAQAQDAKTDSNEPTEHDAHHEDQPDRSETPDSEKDSPEHPDTPPSTPMNQTMDQTMNLTTPPHLTTFRTRLRRNDEQQ
ncbi:hypothetical protein BDZ89DRAFT_242785 [Hymenopellis radicata]|nr:hypothetical protein BDZ89DRAFT_242785 [Hymenopellis radicata]